MSSLLTKAWVVRQQPVSDWTSFIDYWQQAYRYPSQNELYELLVAQRSPGHPADLTPQQIRALFNWKNNTQGILSTNKTTSVERIIQRLDTVNTLGESWDEAVFNHHFGTISIVWQVYLMHIINPFRFPIFDQHVYRAHAYLTGNGSLELKGSNRHKRLLYQDYRLFFKQVAKAAPAHTVRQVDQALWAFGKFLKQAPFSD